MTISFRNYNNEPGISEDYFKVRDFIIRLGYSEFTYARWDWMITHGILRVDSIHKIGIWEDKKDIVGVATFDLHLGNAFYLTSPGYEQLKREMLLYSIDNLSDNDELVVVIQDTDKAFQDIAAEHGFYATEDKESDAIFYLDKTPTDYNLPDGFRITSMKDTYDPYQYRRVLWKGFNHELNGEGEFIFKGMANVDLEMLRPNVDLELKIAVIEPEGNFVSYCGMWYDEKAGFAFIEPVATDPEYRGLGLGKAAVLEGIRRVGEKGAKIAIVGSSQQFYYSIGMRPFATSTLWRHKQLNNII